MAACFTDRWRWTWQRLLQALWVRLLTSFLPRASFILASLTVVLRRRPILGVPQGRKGLGRLLSCWEVLGMAQQHTS